MLSRTPTGRVPAPQKKPEKQKEDNASYKISSQKLKIVSPLGNEKHKTPFSAIYSKGGVPCRLEHGSVKHKIIWHKLPQSLDYNPLFLTFLLGLKEDSHPYTSLVERGLCDLIDAPEALQKIFTLMPQVVGPLRAGLTLQGDRFFVSLQVFRKLVLLLGENMVSSLTALLPPIASKIMNKDPKVREAVQDTLTDVQLNCGPDALKILRQKCPTYSQLQ
ncbi:parkin co-regulated protein-domain-containing protein [Gorgonomyces haynaldii]|nr:parkin co-regulated protein-domain-containing protein [Gorgonomyces haynaldii]